MFCKQTFLISCINDNMLALIFNLQLCFYSLTPLRSLANWLLDAPFVHQLDTKCVVCSVLSLMCTVCRSKLPRLPLSLCSKCWLKPLQGQRLCCRMLYVCAAPSLNLKIRDADQTFVRTISLISLNSGLLLFLLAATPGGSSPLISFHLLLSLIWDQFCNFSPLKLKRGLAGHVTRLVPQISLRVLSSFTNSTPAVFTLILPDDCVTSPTVGLHTHTHTQHTCTHTHNTHITMLLWPTEAEALERY